MPDEPVGKHVTARRMSTAHHGGYHLLDKRGEKLGHVEWYHDWRRYVMVSASSRVVWSDDCLVAVAKFLRAATAREVAGGR